jgi:hypothetical protein
VLPSYCKEIVVSSGHLVHEISVLSPSLFMPENSESMTVKWMRGKVSNLEYLLALNKCAGRSMLDCSRYPILPWCVNSYDTGMIKLYEPSYFRDLSKPFGLISDNERAAAYEAHYAGMVRDQETQPYFFGTYISNCSSVLQYLLRLEPVSSSWKAFYGRVHESPERIFHSLVRHYQTLASTSQDLKEAIPEFYSLPEMFLNVNGLSIVEKPTENWRVENFEFPSWAKDNPYHFVYLHRIILESDIVGDRLPAWLNLIFGSHQQGKKALASKNIYQPTVYTDGALKAFKVAEKKGDLLALYSQIYYFGQSPSRLFDKDHPARIRLAKPLLRGCLSTVPLETKACNCGLKDNSPPPSVLCGLDYDEGSATVSLLTSHWALHYKLTVASLILRLESKSSINRLASRLI